MGGLPLDFDSYEVGGFQLSHLLFAFVLGASFIFLLYWLWTCPCRPEGTDPGRGEESKPILPKQSVKPIYALELEPGIVVLQSEDGEFFRILREYESADQRGHSLSAQELIQMDSPSRGLHENEPILPTYTQACYQTMPSAPPLSQSRPRGGGNFPRPAVGAALNPFGDGNPWMPLHNVATD